MNSISIEMQMIQKVEKTNSVPPFCLLASSSQNSVCYYLPSYQVHMFMLMSEKKLMSLSLSILQRVCNLVTWTCIWWTIAWSTPFLASQVVTYSRNWSWMNEKQICLHKGRCKANTSRAKPQLDFVFLCVKIFLITTIYFLSWTWIERETIFIEPGLDSLAKSYICIRMYRRV